MRTDELRRELHDLADELDPFTGDAGRVRARVRRTRLATAGALTLLLVIGVGAVVVVAGGDDNGVTTVDGKSVDVDDLPERDALVVGAPGDADRIRTRLEQSDLVAHYVVLRPGVASSVVAQFGPSNRTACEPDAGFLVDSNGDDEAVSQLGVILPPGASAYSWRDWVDPPRWRDADAEIFMNVDASAAQVDAIRAMLEDDPDIANVRHLSKDDAYQEFTRVFADQPDLIASTRPDALPESFRLTLAHDTNLSQYQVARGVNEVVTRAGGLEQKLATVEYIIRIPRNQAPGGEVEVFMNVDATDEQIENVRAELSRDPGVEQFRFLSKDDAYAEFTRIFHDQPALIESTLADSLPVSFRIEPHDDAVVSSLRSRYEGIVGVNEVVTAQSTLCD